MDDGNGTAVGFEAHAHYGPSAKQRTAVQHIVRRLLDDLAPECPPARGARPPATVERHRTPRGCILQAATVAVSVSWFQASASDATLGELQVIAWRGVVCRPGSAARPTSRPVPLWQAVLWPEEVARDAWVWRGADERVFETAALVARCHALLDAHLAEAELAGRAS